MENNSPMSAYKKAMILISKIGKDEAKLFAKELSNMSTLPEARRKFWEYVNGYISEFTINE